MGSLERQAEGIWTAAAPLKFLGLHLGCRMTVVRLPSSALWLHSAVHIDAELKAEIDALGRVEHIVAPNAYHHLHAGAAAALWPKARVHGPRGLRKRRPDLRIDAELAETPDPAWGGALLPMRLLGTLLHETVFLHRPTRTLIVADLVENFAGSPHLPTDLYLRVAGLHGQVGVSRLGRFVFRDREAARRSVDRILGEDFDRIVLAHGRVIPTGGAAAVRAAYRWLA